MSNSKIRQLQYRFRAGSNTKGVPAQDAGEELARIHAEHGTLRPADVVEESRPDDAVLHPVFEWDDSKAADEHRKWQARMLIRSVVTVAETGKQESAYAHVQISEGYQPMAVIVETPDMLECAKRELLAKVVSAERSARELLELIDAQGDAAQRRKAKSAHRHVEQANAAVRAL